MKQIFLLCLLYFLPGCFSNDDTPRYSFQSKEEVVKENVLSSPNVVTVPYSEGRGAVERLVFLFGSGLKLPLTEANRAGQSRVWNSRSTGFLFQITETLGDSGVTYRVDVRPFNPKDAEQAILNSKNLARFMAKGVFERSLFVP